MKQKAQDTPYETALQAAAESPVFIAAELRAMAEGQGAYASFVFQPPWVRTLWRTAAELLEGGSKDLHDSLVNGVE